MGYTFNGLNGKSKDDFGHGSAKYITYMNVYKNPIATLEELDLIEIDKSQNEIKKGDILFTTSSETPEEVGLSSVWMYEITNIYLNSFCFGFRLEQKISINYMAYMLRSNSIRNKITLLAQGISRYNISKKGMMNIEVFLPSYAEQTQIGNFFKQLDDTIALHQRELEKFKILKTSYLEHIFLGKVSLFTAKNTITWEQRKLGEVVERITRKNLNLESRLPLTISAQDGLISQTEFFDKQVASKNISGYYLIENGEFAYNKSYSNGYPWGAIKRLDKYKNGVLSTLYIVFKPIDVDSQFLVSYFDTTFWHSEIAEIAVEGARNHGLLNIPVMDFFRIKIKIPKSKEEQTQIGNFFKQLDDTIALHQKELAKYQQIKTACLEKMFME